MLAVKGKSSARWPGCRIGISLTVPGKYDRRGGHSTKRGVFVLVGGSLGRGVIWFGREGEGLPIGISIFVSYAVIFSIYVACFYSRLEIV